MHKAPSTVVQWTAAQVGHRSSYSIERLHALDSYCHKASHLRGLMVCFLTPVPALLAMIVYEMIPLQVPTAGWKANYGTWLRYAFLTFTISLGLTFQVKGMSPGVSIALWQCITISSRTSVCFVAVSLLIASSWTFPIPFSFLLTLPHFVFFKVFWTFIIVGRQWITNSAKLSQKFKRYVMVATFPSFVAIAYIMLLAAFSTLSEYGQIATVLLLPFARLVLKNFMAWVSASLEEGVAGIVVFSVELAHALFVTTCMQSARSLVTSAMIIPSDAMQSFASMRTLRKETKTVQRLLHRYKRHWDQESTQLELVLNGAPNLPKPGGSSVHGQLSPSFAPRTETFGLKIDEMGRYERIIRLVRKAKGVPAKY